MLRSTQSESGFALIEVIVGALLIVTIAGGALAALQASDRAVADERHRARAYGVGQDDQARLRSMRISELANLNETRTVTVEGVPYTVNSRGDFVTDSTGTASCEQGQASADYIRITSTVGWPALGNRPPVLVQSTVAPPNGSISEDHGALAVAVQNGQGEGISGVGLTGTGPGSFSGATGENGCAIFGNLAAGNYTLTPAISAGLVDRDGDPPEPMPASVVGLSTNTVVLQYDTPGAIDVSFETMVGGNLVPSSADSLVVFNTGMTDAEVFGSPGGTRTATLTASQLFPFAAPDTVYAGACTGNNPDPFDENPSAALTSVTVPAGGTATASVQLPALHLTVFSGTGTSNPGAAVANARVTVSDDRCSIDGAPVKRTFTTNAAGKLADPGLPWSRYDICADNGVRRRTITNQVVENLTAGTVVNIFLTGTGSSTGTCP